MRIKATTLLCIAATAATLAIAGRCVLGDEEFVGPLAGWKNVKADYGAVGDGKADDTAAIQRAFDDLRLHKDSCVLYFPPPGRIASPPRSRPCERPTRIAWE